MICLLACLFTQSEHQNYALSKTAQVGLGLGCAEVTNYFKEECIHAR